MSDDYYLKAAGDNNYGPGSFSWLKIRGFKALKDTQSKKEMYELKVIIGEKIQYIMITDPYRQPYNLKFKDSVGNSVSFLEIIQYFKNKSIGLLI